MGPHVIELTSVLARVPPVALHSLTVQLGAGAFALLGGRADGPSIVLGAVAGRLAFRGGSARVLGFPPGDPGVRKSIAHVPLEVALPAPLRVREALALASRIRGEPGREARVRLEPFGIDALAERTVHSLSREEARAVAFAEALTSTARVLLLEEPLAAVDSRALGAIADALRARARAGACVVVATGSTRDARTLADEVLTFERGHLLRRAPATDPLVLAGPRGANVRVVASDAKRLATALSAEDAVRTVAVEGGVLVAGGTDVVSVAAAIARAAWREKISLDLLRADLLREDELRSAIAGDTAGAYRAAYERALGPAPGVRSGTHPEELA
jgi:ABC-type multidrug transport system ATPase subunit